MREVGQGLLAPAVAALIGRPLGDGERFAVAVSGGPDSLALLLLAQVAFGDRVCALTVDHDLRPGSADEAAGVAATCTGLGVPHATLRWIGDKPGGNIQAAARDVRYDLMRDWCAGQGVAWLATGHHADDVAETLLLRLARGSGIAGLVGIRPSRDLGEGVTLLRPMLGERRSALAEVVAAAGLVAIDDPSNSNPRFDRTQARALLKTTAWLDPERLAATVAHLREAEAALDWAAQLAWDSRATAATDSVAVDAAGLPAELRRRLLQRALQALGGAAPGPELARFMARLDAGEAATSGGIQGRGGAMWTFRRVRTRDNRRNP